MQPQRQLRDYAQGSLRADEQAGEVVAGGRLRRGRARADRPAARQDRLEREDVRPHLAVAHRCRPRRVRGGHAAERGVRARVDWEEEPVLAGSALEHASGNARLDRRDQILGLQRQDAIHAREVEADAARVRDHVPFQAGARSEGDDGHAVLLGEPQHVRHILGRRGVDDDVGPTTGVDGHVLGVQIAIRCAQRDPGRSRERATESLSHRLCVHKRTLGKAKFLAVRVWLYAGRLQRYRHHL